MEARVTLCGGMRFVGQADSGHAVVMDTGQAHGGADSGVRPNELLLIGLAGCTGMDVISILRKKRQVVTGLEVVVRGELPPAPPKRFTQISVEYRVRGRGLDPAAVARAIELSETTYCSVGLSLRAPVALTSSYAILPEEDPAT
ncbi:MAG TPA: OsmC family protein [Candidatus Methanoperedens sp.]|nr:OsmC family protein [Candidatus Methanoperedens sp.]